MAPNLENNKHGGYFPVELAIKRILARIRTNDTLVFPQCV